MPNAVVKSYAEKTGKSAEHIEGWWKEAEQQAKKKFKKKGPRYWAYVNGIVKRRAGLSEQTEPGKPMSLLQELLSLSEDSKSAADRNTASDIATMVMEAIDNLIDGHDLVDSLGENPTLDDFEDPANEALEMFLTREGEPEDSVLSEDELKFLRNGYGYRMTVDEIKDEMHDGYADLYRFIKGED